jgi:hypothetical protein
MKKMRYGLSMIACLLFLFFGQNVFGAEQGAEGYSVSANIPEFQTNKEVSYFDLLLKPEEQKEISIHLANNTNEPATYQVQVNNAVTNSNGVIDYSKSTVEKDSSAKYELNKLVTPKTQEVTLQGGEQKDIAFQVNMPSESFKGIILGGIHIEKKESDKKKVDGTGIRNKYAYVIGIKLQNSLDKVDPDLKLLAVEPGLQNSYTTIFATLQNPKATILSHLDIKAKITKKDGKEVLYSAENNSASMAPNTTFKFPIDLKKQQMKAGDYTVTIDALQSDTGKKWHLTKDFTIKKAAVKRINKEAVIEKQPTDYLPYIIAVAVLLLGVIFFLTYKLIKQQNKGR